MGIIKVDETGKVKRGGPWPIEFTFDICNTFLMYVQRTHRFNPGLKASLVSSLTNMMYSATAGTIRT